MAPATQSARARSPEPSPSNRASCPCSGNTSRIEGQAQKAFFVNEAHALTDALLHPAIEGEANDPPPVPADGDTWLVGNTPTGAWADHAGELASLQAGTWVFVTPRDGIKALDKSTGQEIRFVGGWQRPVAPAAPNGGAIVDAEARTAIAELVAALADGGFFAEP